MCFLNDGDWVSVALGGGEDLSERGLEYDAGADALVEAS